MQNLLIIEKQLKTGIQNNGNTEESIQNYNKKSATEYAAQRTLRLIALL